VTSEGNGSVTFASWVSPDVDKTVIISSGYQITVFREVYIVDVSAICSRGENAIYKPTEFSVICRPLSTNCIGCSISVLLIGLTAEKKKLMGSAD